MNSGSKVITASTLYGDHIFAILDLERSLPARHRHDVAK